MKFLLLLYTVISLVVWTVASLYVVLLVLTAIPQFSIPQLSHTAYVITSGSMEPTIMTGDLIFVKPQSNYGVGDIITYQTPRQPVITHRIIAQDTTANSFTTKGDNNEDQDTEPVLQNAVKGLFQFKIPFAGYLLVYGKSPLGLALLIGAPILLVLLDSLVISDLKKPTRTTSAQRPSSTNDS